MGKKNDIECAKKKYSKFFWSTKKKIIHRKKNLLIIVGFIKISVFEIACKYHNGLKADNIMLNNKNKIDR